MMLFTILVIAAQLNSNPPPEPWPPPQPPVQQRYLQPSYTLHERVGPSTLRALPNARPSSPGYTDIFDGLYYKHYIEE